MNATTWPLPLGAPPRLFMMGRSNHHPRQSPDRYRLPGLWCIHFYRYNGELRINGEVFPIRPGHVGICPPGATLDFRYDDEPSRHACAHFSVDDGHGPVVDIAAMQPLGDGFGAMLQLFEESVGWHAAQPARAAARVWDVLWQLAAWRNDDSGSAVNEPSLAETLRRIELGLGGAITVARLAEQAGFSHNHFIRRFVQATGKTPAAYIRRRRAEQATHLLRYSTLPAKAIAAQCGLGDLQTFNKVLRREMGLSPRAVRAGATTPSP